MKTGRWVLTIALAGWGGLGLAQEAQTGGTEAIEKALASLKAAEAKKDLAEVKKWSAEASRLARPLMAPAKAGDEEAKQRAEYAKQVDTYAEYSLFAVASASADPATIADFTETLEQRNPQSQYLNGIYGRYLNALRQSGQADKASEAAARELARDPDNEEVLLIAADASQQKRQPEKTIQYATKLIEVVNAKAKPDGVSDADWQKKKNTTLGLGYWMAGVAYNGQSKFADADKMLRQALPLIQGDNQVLAIGLFHLGLADYNLAKGSKNKATNKAMLRDALKYSTQAAAIKGPLQAQAETNVKAIRKELGLR